MHPKLPAIQEGNLFAVEKLSGKEHKQENKLTKRQRPLHLGRKWGESIRMHAVEHPWGVRAKE